MEIKDLFKNKKIFKKGGLSATPEFFWQILLIVAFVIIVGSSVFSILIFEKVDKEPIFDVGSATSQSQIINKDRIIQVLNYFAERAKKSDAILAAPSPIVDPSL